MKDGERHIVTCVLSRVQEYQWSTLKHLCTSQKDNTIHLVCISCGDEFGVEDMMAVCKATLHVHNLENSSLIQDFKSMYRHLSVNAYTYEFFCFARHIAIRQIVEKYSLPSIISVDADMVFFDNLGNIIPPGETLDHGAAYLIHWTNKGLDIFVEYLMNFYARDLDKVVADVMKHGDHNLLLSRETIRKAIGAQYESEKIPHFSDMYLLAIFMELFPRLLSPLCTGLCSKNLQPMQTFRLISEMDCDKGVYNASVLDWMYNESTGIKQPVYHGETLLGMHMSGNCKDFLKDMPLL